MVVPLQDESLIEKIPYKNGIKYRLIYYFW